MTVPPSSEGGTVALGVQRHTPEGLKAKLDLHDGMEVMSVLTSFATADSDLEPEPQHGAGWGGLWCRVARRKWPLIMTAVVLATGMGFMLGWAPIVQHRSGWTTGGDLWGIWRAAHYIGWGFLGGVYDPSTGVNSLPGLEIILAPFAMLSDHLALTESFAPYFLPHPTAALILEPVELLLASTVLFASDALAQRLGVSRGRRIPLCLLVAILTWPTVAVWGHAEDCLALAFAIYALIGAFDDRWARSGWLFGFAIATQPLVVMALPLIIASSPRGQRLALAIRSFALSAVLACVAFASDAADTFRSLVEQPTPPSVNHATPWASLSPRVAGSATSRPNDASVTLHDGHWIQHVVHPKAQELIVVSGGAGRSIEVVIAILVGFYVWRRPQSPERFAWLFAAMLGMRCMFEAVMTPYYLAPPLILALVVASLWGSWRFCSAAAISLEMSIFAYHHLSPWAWWLPVVVGMAAVLALGYPNLDRSGAAATIESESGDNEEAVGQKLSLRRLTPRSANKQRAPELVG